MNIEYKVVVKIVFLEDTTVNCIENTRATLQDSIQTAVFSPAIREFSRSTSIEHKIEFINKQDI